MSAIIHSHHRSRGQSLVETALFLPILLILLGGVVEVSNLLVTQNRVTTAARAATGYGAANFQGEEWDDPNIWAVEMASVATNNVTNTLDLDPEVWDIYTVKATLNAAATAFDQWTAQHAYGNSVVASATEWSQMESQIQTDVIDALDPSHKGLEVVATVAFHDRASMLGLNAFNFGELTRVRGLSVMRVADPVTYAACDAFPVAVSLYNNSVWPYGDPNIPDGDEEFPFESGQNYGGENYHWKDRDDGVDAPVYELGDTEQFPRNVPGVPITQAQPGYLYMTKQATESDSSGFGWLRWIHDTSGGSNSSGALQDSLTYPGNANVYDYSPWSDNGMNTFDIIPVSTGSVSSAKDIMRTHIDTPGRTLKLIVFTPTNIRGGDWNGDGFGTNGSGSSLEYEIYGFVVVKLIAWYLPGNQNWMVVEFVRWDDTCP